MTILMTFRFVRRQLLRTLSICGLATVMAIRIATPIQAADQTHSAGSPTEHPTATTVPFGPGTGLRDYAQGNRVYSDGDVLYDDGSYFPNGDVLPADCGYSCPPSWIVT